MKLLRVLSAVGALASAALSFAQSQQILVAADFAHATVTAAPADRVTVGNVTFLSNRRALTVVELGGGAKALRFQSKNGGWLRVAFAPAKLNAGHVLSLQTQLQFPDGAPDKGGAVRAGLFALTQPDALDSVAADQGFLAVTNPGSASGEPDTTLVRDSAKPGGSGKWPGFLGGGDGTTRADAKGAVLNLGHDWATLLVAAQFNADKKSQWRATFVLVQTGAPVKHAASFGESKDFPPCAFNAAGLSVSTGDALLLRSFVVAVITPKK